jgi:hypothetical protein
VKRNSRSFQPLSRVRTLRKKHVALLIARIDVATGFALIANIGKIGRKESEAASSSFGRRDRNRRRAQESLEDGDRLDRDARR